MQSRERIRMTEQANPQAADSARSSSERVLSIIDLFKEQRPQWSIEEIASHLGLARTTAYRYAKTLVDAGFLASLNAGIYVLGPRIIELDRQIRLGDPMLRVAPPIMASIRKQASGLQLLCSYYGDRVMCIHQDVVEPGIDNTFDRGRPFPLFVGGPSRVILAHLPNRQLRSLMLHNAPAIARAGLGETWPEFSKNLRRIRQAGYFASQGEIHPENFGVVAPVMHTQGVAGCLCIARPMSRLKERDIPRLIALTVDTAARISAGIQSN